MRRYLLTNISRKPLMIFDQMLASSLSSITNTPGTMVIEHKDLSNYDIVVYLRRNHILIQEMDFKGRIIVEKEDLVEEIKEEAPVEKVVDEVPVLEEAEVLEEIEVSEEDGTEDTHSEPKPEMYTEDSLAGLTSSELRSILSSFGVSSNARKKSKLIEKILEAQDV